MNIKPFAVEEWMNAYETGAKYNIAETCVDSISLDELFELSGTDKDAFLNKLCARRLTYGAIEGSSDLKEGIASLYRTMAPQEIVPTHGASGGNHHVFYSLINPGDKVISIMPSYQQLYSIPASLGADVKIMHLKKENGYLPDVDELKKLAEGGVKMICLNNPNNPTGSIIPKDMMEEIVDIARNAGAYLFCDEVYAGVSQKEEDSCPSVADLYEKGIATGSMSKAFSLAGLRLGWLATRDKAALSQFRRVRDYDLVSCSLFDESVAALALHHKEKILERNRAILRHNLPVLERWVEGEKHVSFVKPKAGTMALVYYDLDMPSSLFCHRMYHETGAFAVPGDCFEEPSSFRVGYGHDGEKLANGLEAVSEFFRKLEEE